MWIGRGVFVGIVPSFSFHLYQSTAEVFMVAGLVLSVICCVLVSWVFRLLP